MSGPSWHGAWSNSRGVPPLTRSELDKIPAEQRRLAIKLGYLRVVDGVLYETEVRS